MHGLEALKAMNARAETQHALLKPKREHDARRLHSIANVGGIEITKWLAELNAALLGRRVIMSEQRPAVQNVVCTIKEVHLVKTRVHVTLDHEYSEELRLLIHTGKGPLASRAYDNFCSLCAYTPFLLGVDCMLLDSAPTND
jgi:hypothetical protein